jgi:nucleoside-diphosphate-sugar epimerase
VLLNDVPYQSDAQLIARGYREAMKVLVTGSSGHLGEALVRTLRHLEYDVVGLDIVGGAFTNGVGSITERACLNRCMNGVQCVFHAATLHKPHVATHTRQGFVDTNITGTLNLLEESVEAGVEAFIFTSTTSVFGDALIPAPDKPAAWITEAVVPIPKNIYGVTKAAAEDLCQLFHRNHGLNCMVLRTSRFFPEEDDNPAAREMFADENLKANEFLYRRVDVEDVVSAHLLAAERAKEIGFGKFIISATTPFSRDDLAQLRNNAPAVVKRYVPAYDAEYARRGWKMFAGIDRVYVNDRARQKLGWCPQYDFKFEVERLRANEDIRSPLARSIGSRGYHRQSSTDGPHPVSR